MDALTSNPRFPDPEKDLFSDAMDAAASVFHSVRHGILRNAERAGETTDGEVVVRRSIAAAFNAYVRELRLADEPSSVAVNEPVFYRCETCKEIMLAAHLVGTDSHERIEETSEGQPYQVTCGPVRPSVLSAGEYINRFLPANWMNDSSLETWFPITAEELKRLKDERAAQPPSAWRPIETAPKDREVLFWVVPLSAEETYRDTSGNPITSGAQPRVMFCRFGRWSSLSKATHWADVPTGCPSETKDAGECGACDKPGEHCANVHGICSRHGGRAHETSDGSCPQCRFTHAGDEPCQL